MKVLVSKYIVNFFIKKKIKNFFVYQGGNIMHLINEIGLNKKTKYIVPYHEQSLSMQVDTAARIDGYSVGMVTSGPGATNILTGVSSAYYDSTPCFFITGQVGQAHIKRSPKKRQFGFQETDVVNIFKSVTKYCKQIKKSSEIRYELEKAYYISKNKRPGPVLLDIPFNIQKEKINPKNLKKFTIPIKKKSNFKIKEIINLIKKSKKPLFIFGGGIKKANLSKIFVKMSKKFNIPFVSTWMTQDIINYDNKLYLGSIGKNGHRSANFACEKADLIISFGQRFAVKNIFGNFGKNAKIIAIDADQEEMKTPLARIDLKINSTLEDFIKSFNLINIKKNDTIWSKEVKLIKKQLFIINLISKKINYKKFINPFIFFNQISRIINKDYIIHTDIGAHQTWFFQSFLQKRGQQIINHCGHGAMGHALCSSIAACFTKFKNKKNIVFIGDGGLSMNIQELIYVKNHNLNIKIVVLNNKSLGNTFLGTLATFNKTFGNDNKTGYISPNIKTLSQGFEIKYFSLNKNSSTEDIFKKFLNHKKAAILDVSISKFQPTAELNQITSSDKIIYVP
jgi:acetolactate synthase-1/2/3 large subunit